MGLAIIVPDLDFSGENLGNVTLINNIPVQSLSIVASNEYIGTSFKPAVAFTPANTAARGVVWSIESGSSYATINASTGVVTILSGASNSEIIVRATSSSDSSIYDEKTISVTYSGVEVIFHDVEQSMLRSPYSIGTDTTPVVIQYVPTQQATRQIVVIPIPYGSSSLLIKNLTADVGNVACFIASQDINLNRNTNTIGTVELGTSVGVLPAITIPSNAGAVVLWNKVGDGYTFENVKQYAFL